MHNNQQFQSQIQENKTKKCTQSDYNQRQTQQSQSAIHLHQNAQLFLMESAIQFNERSQHFNLEQDSELMEVQYIQQEDQQNQQLQDQKKQTFCQLKLDQNITLSPNGSIIVGKCFNELQLSCECKILQYEQKAFKMPSNSKKSNQFYLYKGQMDPYGECFQGRGTLTQCKQGTEYEKFEGNFYKGYAVDQCRITKMDKEIILAQYQEGIVNGIMETYSNGQRIAKQIYKNGKLVNNQSCVFVVSQIFFITKETYINYRIFQTLNYGQWLNQKILDIYINLVYKDLILMKEPQNLEFQDILITPSQFQDIFSSQMSNHVEANLQLWNLIMDTQKNINERNTRYIFMINHQRSHFLVIVKEGDTLYELNSLRSYYSKSIILPLFEKCLRQIPEMNQQYQTRQIEIPQQTNDFDCGIYSIATTIRILQNPRKSVTSIFKDFHDMQPKLLRKHIRNVLLDNYHNYILR